MTPSFEFFMLPMLKFLSDEKPHSLKELKANLPEIIGLTEEDKQERTKKGTYPKYIDRINWSCVYLSQSKVIKSISKGTYVITQRGQELLLTSPSKIDMKVLEQFPEFIDFKNRKKTLQENTPNTSEVEKIKHTPFELMEQSYDDIRNELIKSLLSEIKSQTPQFFERLVIKLLVAMGYGGSFDDAASVTKYSHDEGIDGVIKEDRLGLDSIYIQAKRYDNGSVGRKDIQSFVGALSGKGATKGIFITTSQFTKEAKDYKPASNIKIVLIDGNQLANYMIDYNIGVSTRQTFEIKRIDSDFFTEE